MTLPELAAKYSTRTKSVTTSNVNTVELCTPNPMRWSITFCSPGAGSQNINITPVNPGNTAINMAQYGNPMRFDNRDYPGLPQMGFTVGPNATLQAVTVIEVIQEP